MKKLFYILFFLFPVVVSAQFNLYKDSPLDYAWKCVGNAGFSAGDVSFYISLVFNPSGEPYVAFSDGSLSYKATVMKFDGVNWVYVGLPGFTTAGATFTNIAFDSSGQLYIAFSDETYSYKASVKREKFF